MFTPSTTNSSAAAGAGAGASVTAGSGARPNNWLPSKARTVGSTAPSAHFIQPPDGAGWAGGIATRAALATSAACGRMPAVLSIRPRSDGTAFSI
jgi:hypothetical protein